MVKIASWNVNSIKARLPNVLDWLSSADPDIVLLQEIKSVEETFPALEISGLGYNLAISGQKSYNGVAILSKTPLEIEHRSLPGDESDEQARYVEAVTETDAGVLRVASIYLPNGNPVDSDKFGYKLGWMKRLERHARDLLALEEPTILGGDYNVIPNDEDCYDPAAWAGDALFRPESRSAFRALVNLGFTDAFRSFKAGPGAYTFWDYQAGAWQKDNGIRIDHLLLSPQAADLLVESDIDRAPRGKPKASDHTPIWCALAADPAAAKAA
ncbi:MAG TPA: exodeoxyribonuclease III [Alphaproteobacteria bacterium]|nr:exodeoxyribonuclease III [Alphaproteobacteria bacterium]